MRIAVVPTAALDVGGFGLDDPKALAAAVGVAAAGVAAYVSRSNTAAQVPALRWDDNARWLETCKAKGVVSWYDAGLRLTASETPAPTPAPAPASAPYLAPSPVAKKKATFTVKPCFSGDAYGRSQWPASIPSVAAAGGGVVATRPTRRSWSGGMYDASGRAPAPPTEADRSTAARMAAVAKVLAKTTIPRVGVRPSRRAWSGSPYGLSTPKKKKSFLETMFGE